MRAGPLQQCAQLHVGRRAAANWWQRLATNDCARARCSSAHSCMSAAARQRIGGSGWPQQMSARGPTAAVRAAVCRPQSGSELVAAAVFRPQSGCELVAAAGQKQVRAGPLQQCAQLCFGCESAAVRQRIGGSNWAQIGARGLTAAAIYECAQAHCSSHI